jgi:CRISPR-associated protein Cmr4
MNSIIIGLLAETNLHPGAESSTGIIDLPVAREVHSGYPVILGSSLKGAIKDLAVQTWEGYNDGSSNRNKEIFGAPNSAGAFATTDARLLLLPVRSLSGHYKWITCPYLLERYQRDRELAGMQLSYSIPRPEKGAAISNKNGQLFLEELTFMTEIGDLTDISASISPLIRHGFVSDRLMEQLVILNDDDFAYFASYGLQVNARNELDDQTKTSKNLWYEEVIPPDTLFYALLIARQGKDDALKALRGLFVENPYLQVGGNETIGQDKGTHKAVREQNQPG